MTRLRVLYFASLRDGAGQDAEWVETAAASLDEVYEALRARHGFALPAARLRVAVDGDFARWEDAPVEGSEVAFIPPVSGG
ncbi:MAG: MoaD/ThiS family protein [Lysobacteraceae bacterium]